MQGRPNCWGCGYFLSPPSAKHEGHRFHVGCLDAYLYHKKRTKELLEEVAALNKKEKEDAKDEKRSA